MAERLKQGLKAVGEGLLLPLFLVLVIGVCLPWLKLRAWLSGPSAKPKVIWGPTPIINISTNAAADRLYGYQSDTLVYRPYYITSQFTYNLERWWRYKPLALVIPGARGTGGGVA